MTETRTSVGGLTEEARRYILNETAFRQRCELLGAHTEAQRCKLAGISRASLNRWRRGVVTPSLPVLDRMTERLGTTRERLICEVVA